MPDPAPGALLSVDGLNVSYAVPGGYLAALRDWTVSIPSGRVVGILGESGSGKTTAALALLGLLPPDALVSGSARFQKTELIGASETALQKIRGAQISLIQQEPLLSLNPVIRLIDQVAEVLRAHFPLSAAECRQRAREALAQVGLSGESLQRAYPHQLSGGQRQRVAIAQAIVCGPSLVIADEPTGALDAVSALEILKLLHGLVSKMNASLILITHDPRLLSRFADHILVMHQGRTVEHAPTSQ